MRRFAGCVMRDAQSRFASQPKAAARDGVEILFRGYIANARALAEEARRHEVAASAEDLATLFAYAYRRWHRELSRHVVGEYSLVIHDRANGQVLLTHDELGLVPLFFSAGKDRIVFATYLEDLLQHTGIGTLDEEYIADYLARGIHFGASTPFADIRRVAAGEAVLWNNGHIERRSTWSLPDVRPLHYSDPRDYEKHFAHLVKDAVADTVPATGKVWCELSGGLDSSTVLNVAASVAPQRLEAVSFVYSQSHRANEQPWMRIALGDHPMRWNRIDIDAHRPFSELPTRFVAEPGDRLFAQASTRFYEDLVRDNDVAVVLTGQGGDAVLLGDRPGPYFLADLLRAGRLSRLAGALRKLSAGAPAKRSLRFLGLHYGAYPLLRHLRGGLVEDFFYSTPLPRWLADGYVARMDLLRRRRLDARWVLQRQRQPGRSQEQMKRSER